MFNLNDPINAVVNTELYQNVLKEAKKISPNAEVLQCFYYRKCNGILGFKRFGKVHFICCVSLGMTEYDYLLVKDNEVEVVGKKYREELTKLGEMILKAKRFSNSCMLGLSHEDDVFISDVPSARMNNGLVII
jgi:hypothetical protein